jgi:hypothetical protein
LLDLEGSVERRFLETACITEFPALAVVNSSSFHPKVYIFYFADSSGVAFVGSSNLTRLALSNGVEWNYRVVSSQDFSGFSDIGHNYESLFHHPFTRPLSYQVVESYEARYTPGLQAGKEPTGISVEPQPLPVEPHEIQKEALRKLEATREAGNTAGLVVLATGLGKTWLSAFDSNRGEYKRILFIAHREEILAQAMKTFRRIRPEA